MFAYSATKNRDHLNAPYSVWNPPTRSASDSGMSNGWRLVSAKSAIRNIAADSGIVKRNQAPPQKPALALELHHPGQAERSRAARRVDPEEDGHHGEGHRQFVGDQLGRRADAAEERVFRVGCPAGEDQRIDPERGHRKDRQDAHVHIRQHERDRPCPSGRSRRRTAPPSTVVKAGIIAMNGASTK